MYYRKALRDAGFDPANIRDATKADEFTIHISKEELKGSVIGDPMNCAGARACKKQQHAKYAWIGASMAILCFSNETLIRYRHNGQLPHKHDKGMFPIGTYKFMSICKADLQGKREERRKQNKSIRPNHLSKNILKGAGFHPEPSLAAQMRRGWEVETD